MRGRARLLKIGLFVFLTGFLVFFPARVAYHWFAPPDFVASGISGSIWSGRANEASAAGLYVRDLDWRIRPLQLLTGKLGYSITANLAPGFVEGDVAISAGNSIVARDLTASLPLSSLQALLQVPGLSGNASLTIEELRIDGRIPVAAVGVFEVSDLLDPRIHPNSIGGFKAEFFTQAAGISASVEDTDSVLELAGALQVAADGSYRFLGQVAAKAGAPAALRQKLLELGPADPRGQHELRVEGVL